MRRFLTRMAALMLLAALLCVPLAGSASAKRAIGIMLENSSVSFGSKLRGVPVSYILWRSSDVAVGTVQQGRIDAHKAGRTVIAATYRGKTAYCGVVVLPRDVYVPLGQIVSLPASGGEKYRVENRNVAAVNRKGQLLGLSVGQTRLGVASGKQRLIVNVHVIDGAVKEVLAGVRIGIDPGHQGKKNSEQEPKSPLGDATKAKVSSGTAGVVTGTPEHETDLAIALQLRDALVALGAEVYMTRESADVNISNMERARLMSQLNVDLVLRLHCNGSNNPSASGVDVYARETCAYSSKDPARAEQLMANERRAAQAVLEALPAATGAKRNAIHFTDNYTMNNWATVPCLLVEMGFLTNPQEDVLLNDPAYQANIVKGLVNAVCAYEGRAQVG